MTLRKFHCDFVCLLVFLFFFFFFSSILLRAERNLPIHSFLSFKMVNENFCELASPAGWQGSFTASGWCSLLYPFFSPFFLPLYLATSSIKLNLSSGLGSTFPDCPTGRSRADRIMRCFDSNFSFFFLFFFPFFCFTVYYLALHGQREGLGISTTEEA